MRWLWLGLVLLELGTARAAPLTREEIVEAGWRRDLAALQEGTFESEDLPAVARALGALRDRRAVGRLSILASVPDVTVRHAAALALRSTPGGEDVARDRLRVEEDRDVRGVLWRVLGRQGGVSDVTALMEASGRRGAEGVAALYALGGLVTRVDTTQHEEALVAVLLGVLQSPRLPARTAAAFALSRVRPSAMREQTVGTLAEAWARLTEDQARAWLVPILDQHLDATERRAWILGILSSSWRLTRAALVGQLSSGDLDRATWQQLARHTDPWVSGLAARYTSAEPSEGHQSLRRRALQGTADQAERAGLLAQALQPIRPLEEVLPTLSASALLPHASEEELEALLQAADPSVVELTLRELGRPEHLRFILGLHARAESLNLGARALVIERLGSLDEPSRAASPWLPVLRRWAQEGPWGIDRSSAELLARWTGESYPRARLPGSADVVAALAGVNDVLGARLHTSRGVIDVSLEPALAPFTVATFVTLASSGHYDGLPFHRVMPGVLAQTGDRRGDGLGGTGWWIPDESSAAPFVPGVMGMARANPDESQGQWFFAMASLPLLEGDYTRFGIITAGWDVVTRLTTEDTILRIETLRTHDL